jgi:CDP-paratose 2-epimerase
MSKKILVITGSGGLVGVESVKFFSTHFDLIIGIDNDSRGYFFGEKGSVSKNIAMLSNTFKNYVHYPVDIRDRTRLSVIFSEYSSDIKLIINAAAQPSHDWSGKNPVEDFEINALGALNVLETMRTHCPNASFIQLSSSKVYGDNMNKFQFKKTLSRYDLDINHKYYNGFSEDMSIDQSLHSPYGATKLSSDIMCQEYAKYYGLNVGIFRPNCITGGPHSGVELHGFLSYLVKCTSIYNVFGFEGMQVRDNIHASDLVSAFYEYYKQPTPGEVYNLGGGRANSCSIIEAIELVEVITERKVEYQILPEPRIGDHVWWITDNSKFIRNYPNWAITINLNDIISEIHESQKK